MNVAVFASGNGSNFQVLIDKREAGALHASLVLLVTNNRNAYAVTRAERHGIPVECIAPRQYDSLEAYTANLQDILTTYAVDCIVCAGYMKMIPGPVVARYRNKIVNIHPFLLPAFGGKGMYGRHVHEAVLAYGVKVTGITIHFVDEEYDKGPIIFQETIKVLDTDTVETLAERVSVLEHTCYWQVVEAIVQKRITVEGRRVTWTPAP